MIDSILNSTKKTLGLAEDYPAFDEDILMHLNSVFADLYQLGIGPQNGYQVTGEDQTWSDYLGSDYRLNSVRSYVYLRVRFLFDPPQAGFHISAMKEQIEKMEWRITAQGDGWTNV